MAIDAIISSVFAAFDDCGLLESVDAVCDRLDAGQRARPGSEGPQQDKDADSACARRDLVRHDGPRRRAV